MTPTLIGIIRDAVDDQSHEQDRTGGSRELSLVRTKLQEALFWAEAHFNDRKERGLE